MRKARPYLFLGQTVSLCEQCTTLVPAKIAIEDDRVWYLKRCPDHGAQKTLISTDVDYYKSCREYLKPGDLPQRFQTRIDYGCPLDCGLCPDHEQHSCLALIEVTRSCDLTCPVCFAESAPKAGGHRPLAEVEAMLDALCASEGEPDLVQISGGEPTLHPEILPILRACKARPIRHVMLNTNGVRLARDSAFVAELATLKPGFEVYLQFDSLRAEPLAALRGADLRRVREQALANLEAAGIATTLVCVVRKGANDDEIGDILRYALGWSCVRGVSFQPIQDAGRNQGFVPERDRIVLSEIRRAIATQAGELFQAEDLLPLPCNPGAIAIGFALRHGRSLMPVTRLIPRDQWVSTAPNTITFERYPEIRAKFMELLSLPALNDDEACRRLSSLLCCLPQMEMPQTLGYDRVFRVTVLEFLDRFNFCLSAVKRSCVHFVTPAGAIIPFDTYNLFYRNGEVETLRQRVRR